MKFKIIVEIDDCPYKRKKLLYDHNGPFFRCKHPDGDGRCYFGYERLYAVCPIAAMGGMVFE